MPWCPDPAALARFQAAGAGPVLEYAHSGLFDSTVHTFTRAAEFLKHWTFSGGLRAKGHPEIRSALVTVDCLDGRLTARGPDGQVLGSLLDHWLIAMGTHRLELVGTGPHSPRLRLGRVVVQRRSWRIQPEDSMRPDFETLGLSKLIAVHRLQKQFALPREVFVRPLMAVQRTHHKDGKPIFCDFRNPLLVEMLADLLARYRSVRVTEMMPSTDECWLADAEGRYAFELRLAVRPRQS